MDRCCIGSGYGMAMHGRPDVPLPLSPAPFKNRPFHQRLGFALSGIVTVFRRERSFRTQCLLAFVAAGVSAGFRVDPLWAAMVALSAGLVLALEMVNAALEYLADRVHPDWAEEIGRAKDAAAGAVLIASGSAVAVGACLGLAWVGEP